MACACNTAIVLFTMENSNYYQLTTTHIYVNNNNMRKDYLIERNKEIFEEYKKKDESYNTLSKKYGLTPQRIQKIISDFKYNELAINLKVNSPKDEREKLKNKAVEMRESGKLNIGLEMFNKVIEWDKANNNLKGQIDVLGHLKIVFKLMSDREKNNNNKLKLLEKAAEINKQALELAESSGEINKGMVAIQKVHYANIIVDIAKLNVSNKKNDSLKQALKIIDEAIADLPGSKSHMSWALNTKAKIQFLLGNIKDALDSLNYAENCLYEGYDDEMKHGNLAEMKINVWLSGLLITKAVICKETGKYLLAKQYANSVINFDDPGRSLVNRKNQAKKILKSLKNIL